MFKNMTDIPMSGKGCGNWAPSEDGITLTWRDLSIYASIPDTSFFSRKAKSHKRIINNVTGAVKAGSLVALMGPSGAGKSTLMAALAHRNPSGIFLDGDVRINGIPVGNFVHKISGYMHQEDLFVGTLTVREHLHFMARLRLDRNKSRAEINKIIQEFLIQLGLTTCADNRIGAEGNEKVISGGEKKRLAFATEMLTNPPILFCDEPTTGLDSYSAQTLIHFMKLMASHGKTILCTIHQPSSELFDMFHRLILLSEGRTAFIGDTKSALKFFDERGYSCPSSYNPADFFIRTLATTPGTEESCRMRIKRLCDEFTVSQSAREIEGLVQHEMSLNCTDRYEKTKLILSNSDWKEPIWITKLFWLTSRSFLQVLRDPSVQAVRIIQKLAIALMAGLCYAGSVQLTQTGVQSVQGAVFIFVTENTFGGMYAVLSMFPMEMPLFMREYRNGLYSTHLYYISKMLSLLPGLVIEPVLFALVAYWLAGLRNTLYAFSMTALVTILTMNVATACGCFFSNAFESISIALACLVPFDYILMITSGLFIKLDSMPDLIGWFKYLSWFMYSNEAMSILQWENISNISCEYTNPDIPCVKDGAEVLMKYDFAASHLAKDIIAMISMYFIFHVLAYFCLWRKANKNK